MVLVNDCRSDVSPVTILILILTPPPPPNKSETVGYGLVTAWSLQYIHVEYILDGLISLHLFGNSK